MRLTTNDRYLSLLLQTLETRILPQLPSAAARETAGTMQTCLLELLRRERRTTGVLHEAILEGERIEKAMLELLRARGGEYSSSTLERARDVPSSFDNAARQFNELVDALTRLAAALSHRRTGATDAPVASLLRQAAQWEQRTHTKLAKPAEGDRDGNPPDVNPLPQPVLEAFIHQHHPDGDRAKLVSMERATVGLGKQTFLIEVEDAKGVRQPLVVRKMDGGAPLIEFKNFELEHEFELLRAVARTGFPSPTPMWLGMDVSGADGNFYVMNRLPGKVMGTWINSAEKFPESELLHIAELMARLHRIGLDQFRDYIARFESPSLLQDTNEACYRRTITEWREYGTGPDHLSSPSIIFATDWLSANLPHDTRRPVLIHGDFNIHNLLAEHERVTGVLDWECAMFGAPEQDLAWARPNVSKHMSFDKFLAHYEASGGRPVRREWLDYYHAFSSMRQNVIISRGVRNIQDARSTDIRHTLLQILFTPEVLKQSLLSAGETTSKN
ncbi:MAG: phosphotransferase family protein [Steroidobacteraceae bacterium]